MKRNLTVPPGWGGRRRGARAAVGEPQQDPRLSGTGSGDEEQRPALVGERLALVRVRCEAGLPSLCAGAFLWRVGDLYDHASDRTTFLRTAAGATRACFCYPCGPNPPGATRLRPPSIPRHPRVTEPLQAQETVSAFTIAPTPVRK